MEKGRPIMKGLPFLRNNIYKDYHLMIFQALPLRILPAVSSQGYSVNVSKK